MIRPPGRSYFRKAPPQLLNRKTGEAKLFGSAGPPGDQLDISRAYAQGFSEYLSDGDICLPALGRRCRGDLQGITEDGGDAVPRGARYDLDRDDRAAVGVANVDSVDVIH